MIIMQASDLPTLPMYGTTLIHRTLIWLPSFKIIGNNPKIIKRLCNKYTQNYIPRSIKYYKSLLHPNINQTLMSLTKTNLKALYHKLMIIRRKETSIAIDKSLSTIPRLYNITLARYQYLLPNGNVIIITTSDNLKFETGTPTKIKNP